MQLSQYLEILTFGKYDESDVQTWRRRASLVKSKKVKKEQKNNYNEELSVKRVFQSIFGSLT